MAAIAVIIGAGVLLAACKSSVKKEDRARAATERVRALPYVTWNKPVAGDRTKRGAVLIHPEKVVPGLNFFNYESHPEAHLIDISGKVLHVWKSGGLNFDHAELLSNGDVLGVDQDHTTLFKLDWNSRVKWKRSINGHHDLDVASNGDIYLLTEGGEKVPRLAPKGTFVENWIEILSPKGKHKKKTAISKLDLESGLPLAKLRATMHKNMEKGGKGVDGLHANTVELIRHDVHTGGRKLFSAGDVLICVRSLDLVCVVDMERDKILWKWGLGKLQRPHQPSQLDNGNILIFDNGSFRGHSRLVEVDPRTDKVKWTYTAEPKQEFFTNSSGGCHGLPGGSVIATESMRGHAFEVTRRGEVVWEYFSTLFNEAKEQKAIWRMTRITDVNRFPALRRFWKQGAYPARRPGKKP